jgi:hypothetical protein
MSANEGRKEAKREPSPCFRVHPGEPQTAVRETETHEIGELVELFLCLVVLALGRLAAVEELGVVVEDRDQVVLTGREGEGKVSLGLLSLRTGGVGRGRTMSALDCWTSR